MHSKNYKKNLGNRLSFFKHLLNKPQAMNIQVHSGTVGENGECLRARRRRQRQGKDLIMQKFI